MDSSHFESNLKRTINCPATRPNTSEPCKRMPYWRYSGDSRMKKVGVTAGPKKKAGNQHKYLFCMVIFQCNEDWFAMVKPIKPNLGLWISSEPSPESLANGLKFCWLKVICCVCQPNELEREIKHKTGVTKQGPAKNLEGNMTHPGPPLEPSLWRYHCSVTYVTRQWRGYHENFSFTVT